MCIRDRQAKKALFTYSLSVKLKELQGFEVEKITNFQQLISGKNFVGKKIPSMSSDRTFHKKQKRFS